MPLSSGRPMMKYFLACDNKCCFKLLNILDLYVTVALSACLSIQSFFLTQACKSFRSTEVFEDKVEHFTHRSELFIPFFTLCGKLSDLRE